jgi:PIN domain nuclease of toxin-antitoxin system
MRAIGASGIAIEHSHALAISALERRHNDPFDRLLVVQARQLGARILTADPLLAQYDVPTIRLAS